MDSIILQVIPGRLVSGLWPRPGIRLVVELGHDIIIPVGKRDHRSPNPTTRWSDIIRLK